jgi:trans-aconitate 2-methyltransferase
MNAPLDDDWDAAMYDRVMGWQQLKAAGPLIAALGDPGDGLIVEAGCGTGLAVAALLQRFSRARVLALDISPRMLALTRQRLGDHPRVTYCLADLQTFCQPLAAACIFSNATLHWVHNHDVSFANHFATLRPTGVLAAQFAYNGPTNRQLLARLRALCHQPPFAQAFSELSWHLEDIAPQREATMLARAGFIDIRIDEVAFDFRFSNAAEQHQFTQDVILREQTRRLPPGPLRAELVDHFLAWNDALVGPLRQRSETLRCTGRRPGPDPG